MHSRALIASTDKSEASMESGRPPSMDLTGKSRPESQSASPEVDSFSQLIDIASDIKLWKGLVDQIYRKPRRPKRRNEVKLVVN